MTVHDQLVTDAVRESQVAIAIGGDKLVSSLILVVLLSLVPVNVGVVSFVISSVLEEPESDAASRSGVDGAATAYARFV